MFTDMYEVIANPTSLSDEEIWIIILDIIRKFDLFFANTYNNPLWEIFRQGDTTVKNLTGFMLQHYQSSLATKMLGLCRLQPVDYVPTASAVLLAWMLSCIWVPVIVRLNEAKAAYFEPISVQTFEDINCVKCILPQKYTLDVWWWIHINIRLLFHLFNHFVVDFVHGLFIFFHQCLWYVQLPINVDRHLHLIKYFRKVQEEVLWWSRLCSSVCSCPQDSSKRSNCPSWLFTQISWQLHSKQ